MFTVLPPAANMACAITHASPPTAAITRLVFTPPTWRLGPTARLQRKSAGCGLNGFLPRLCLGPLHLNPRPPKDFGALALSPLRPPWQTETRASVFDRKIA